MAEAFESGARELLQKRPDIVDRKFPQLNNWQQAVDLVRPQAAATAESSASKQSLP
jgi:hypothetical protein